MMRKIMSPTIHRKWDAARFYAHNHRDALLGLTLVLLAAVVYYAQASIYLSEVVDSKVNIYAPHKYFWWADDSRDYRATGDWMFGRSEETWIEIRPWLYPLLSGTFRAFLGSRAETALWILQGLLWLASGVFLYFAIYRSVKNPIPAILGSMLFFSHPSPLALTFHGMTETLNIFLLSILLWVFTRKESPQWFFVLFLLGMLTVTKPTYQLQLTIFTVYFIVKQAKLSRLRLAGLVALALLPIWVQFSISLSHQGRLNLSEIGPYTFKNFFVAVVHYQTEDIGWRDSLKIIEDWGTKEQLEYLWSHPRQTVRTYRDNLIDRNLWIGSFFLRGEGNRLADFGQAMNAVALYAHFILLPLVVYFLFSHSYGNFAGREAIRAVYAIFLIQTLAAGISTGQEDRLIITGLPLWIFTYVTVLTVLNARSEEGNQ